LSSFTLDSLPQFSHLRKIVTLPPNALIPDAIKVLTENKITAAPIVDQNDKPVAIVSVMDVMDHCLNNFTEEHLKREAKHTYDFFSLVIARKEIGTRKATEIQELGRLDPVSTIVNNNSSSLYDVVQLMAKNKTHRVLVLDEKGRIKNFITQSRILQFIPVIMDQLPDFRKSLRDLNLGYKKVHTVPLHSMAISAFQLMKEKRISAVGVVDGTKLIGNMSAADIKVLGYSMSFFQILGGTVAEYLSFIQQNALNSSRLNLVKCRESDTLEYVVKICNFHGVHRVYMVDDADKPIGVVSIADILAFCTQPPTH